MLKFKKHKKSLSDHDLSDYQDNSNKGGFNMFSFRPVASFLKDIL